jgi:uncharacterized protein YegP (UPF0339 family)
MLIMTRRLFALLPLVAGLLSLSAATTAAQDTKLSFELYKDKAGEFRWRLKDGDKVLATPGQGYKAKADAKHGIEVMQKSGDKDAKTKYEVYEGKGKDYRWKLVASNGNVMASSAVGYKSKDEAEKSVERVKAGAAKAGVNEVKD